MHFLVKEKFLWPPAKSETKQSLETDAVENGTHAFPQVEFLLLEVHGQSFMLHQIRKMIGLTMAVVRGNTSEDIYAKVFAKEKLDIPKAPSIGLYLENVFFSQYNKKFGTDGIHERLEWPDHEAEVEKFKKEHIVGNILDEILAESVFEDYMEDLQLHSYSTEIGHRLVKIPRRGRNISDDEDDESKEDSISKRKDEQTSETVVQSKEEPNSANDEQTLQNGEKTFQTDALEDKETPNI